MTRPSAPLVPLLAGVVLFAASPDLPAEEEKQQPKPAAPAAEAKPAAGRALFDGKTLEGWEPVNYAGNGGATVADGVLRIAKGSGLLNGVKRKDGAKLPRVNYEVSAKARRVEGDDFFFCLTFPFHKKHATFVIGGWGGSVCGISSIDFMDAMENATMSVREFKPGQWYDFRLRVTDHRIQGFIDGEQMVNANVKGRKVDMRFGEIEESVPFAISTFETTGEYKDIRLRELTKEEIAAAAKLDEKDEF